MKLVLFGDLHLDTPFARIGHVSTGAGHKRRQAFRDVLIRIIIDDVTTRVLYVEIVEGHVKKVGTTGSLRDRQ
jgi:hypothetical protein